jgi:hypothetical protein
MKLVKTEYKLTKEVASKVVEALNKGEYTVVSYESNAERDFHAIRIESTVTVMLPEGFQITITHEEVKYS